MPQITVALSANAGLSVTINKTRIWIDALPGPTDAGYSCVSDSLWEKMCLSDAFRDPDLICFTHCHKDHFSPLLTAKARGRFPHVPLVLPEQAYADSYLLSGHMVSVPFKDLTLKFVRTIHEGEKYADVPHYAVLITAGGRTVLAAGDTQTAGNSLVSFLEAHEIKIDTAILPFPWITLSRGRDCIREDIRPGHLLVCHVPFPEDDINRYREAVSRSLTECRDPADIRILERPLQTETL